MKISARVKLHRTDLSLSAQSTDWMRIRSGPNFRIPCILYGNQENPDCAVRIAVKRTVSDNQHTQPPDKKSSVSEIKSTWFSIEQTSLFCWKFSSVVNLHIWQPVITEPVKPGQQTWRVALAYTWYLSVFGQRLWNNFYSEFVRNTQKRINSISFRIAGMTITHL